MQLAASAQTISFNGNPLAQNFDGMGAAGTNAPAGWFVGSNAATIVYTTNVVDALQDKGIHAEATRLRLASWSRWPRQNDATRTEVSKNSFIP